MSLVRRVKRLFAWIVFFLIQFALHSRINSLSSSSPQRLFLLAARTRAKSERAAAIAYHQIDLSRGDGSLFLSSESATVTNTLKSNERAESLAHTHVLKSQLLLTNICISSVSSIRGAHEKYSRLNGGVGCYQGAVYFVFSRSKSKFVENITVFFPFRSRISFSVLSQFNWETTKRITEFRNNSVAE